jgi:hypothetical protein
MSEKHFSRSLSFKHFLFSLLSFFLLIHISCLDHSSNMGKLHNRRRTRLRPNKKAQHQVIAIPPPSTPLMTQAIFNNYDMSSYHQQLGMRSFNQDKTSKHLSEQHEVRHTQYYGAGEGDESGDLCPLMLRVDYEDP